MASKTAALKQVGLVVDDPFPFPWLFVMLEVGALKPMRADAVMVAGRCVMMKYGNTYMRIVSHGLFQNGDRDERADLGIADAAEGVDGDAGRHWARCCDHACAAWLSWPTKIQLLQALQRTRPLSYLRASGSAATKGGAASLAL